MAQKGRDANATYDGWVEWWEPPAVIGMMLGFLLVTAAVVIGITSLLTGHSFWGIAVGMVTCR